MKKKKLESHTNGLTRIWPLEQTSNAFCYYLPNNQLSFTMIMLLETYIYFFLQIMQKKKKTADHQNKIGQALIRSNFGSNHIMVQLHLDSSFGGFKLSPLIGAPTMRVVDLSIFSSLSVLALL